MAKLQISAQEFERQYRAGVRRGKKRMEQEPQAKSAAYDQETNRLVIELRNGVTFIVPCDLIQGLRGADPKLIKEVELMPHGVALHWEKLDQDFSVSGLITGIFGTQAWISELGRAGGSVKSKTKAAAARQNGLKGGRPPKVKRA